MNFNLNTNLDKWLITDKSFIIRYLSVARHGLALILKARNIGKGNKVLLPEFICKDILDSLVSVGAKPLWYSVGKDLRPNIPSDNWPEASAVIVVNYFGFAQPLDPFKKYTLRTKAIIIEDNAHGFLSKDEFGTLLGTRTGAGIFSIRKSLLIPDGAALVLNKDKQINILPPQLKPKGRGIFPQILIKNKLKQNLIFKVCLTKIIRSILPILNVVKSIDHKNNKTKKNKSSIFFQPEVHNNFIKNIQKYDLENEANRRRELYIQSEIVAKKFGIISLFNSLPEQTVPYGFPFRSFEDESLKKMEKWAAKKGLNLINWPDLPDYNRDAINSYYHNVWVVNFL